MVREQEKVSPASMVFRRAESWRREGKIHQAIDLYFWLMRNFPQTGEANKAEERLLSLAQELEAKGKTHVALDIYEKLAILPALGEGRPKVMLSPMGRPMR
jgi:hypothetical protein